MLVRAIQVLKRLIVRPLGVSPVTTDRTDGGTASVLLVSDTFTRADDASNMGTTETGGKTWVTHSGVAGISSNQAYFSDVTGGVAGYGAAVVDAGVANCRVLVTIKTIDSSQGPVVRASDANNRFQFEDGTLYVISGGALSSNLGSFAYSKQVGDVQEIECRGDSFTVYINGVQKLTGSSSFNNTATMHGIHAAGDTARMDNFEIWS